MANLKQSKKRIRQDKKKYLRNRSNLSRVRTYIKKFLLCITKSDLALVLTKYPLLISEIDKSVRKGVFHRNKANRLKSFFSKKVKLMSGV
ncbi:MAG TPA: 30S ribosomal protein S20 [Candidatus Azoamicus sp. MARI]